MLKLKNIFNLENLFDTKQFSKIIILLLIIFILIIIIYNLSNKTTEGLESTYIENVMLLKNEQITSIEIAFAGSRVYRSNANTLTPDNHPQLDAWINLSEITILDNCGNPIQYWSGNNSIKFVNSGVSPGADYKNLYDNNKNTICHSNSPVDTLLITFNPSVNIGSVQISNRQDCCWTRIQNYNIIFYVNNEIIASHPLITLGKDNRPNTVKYVLIPNKPHKIGHPVRDDVSNPSLPSTKTVVSPVISQLGTKLNGG
jgi:hypothetical protein